MSGNTETPTLDPRIIILSAPSGSGKTTILKALLRATDKLAFSVSATTRPPRTNEIDGKDYYFISVENFRTQITANAFLEWEEVYPGKLYGTYRSEIDRILLTGKFPIFDVDVHGGINLKKEFGPAALAIFIQPPSLAVLESRLRARGSESERDILARVAKASEELKLADQFDVIVFNHDLDTAVNNAIVKIAKFLNL